MDRADTGGLSGAGELRLRASFLVMFTGLIASKLAPTVLSHPFVGASLLAMASDKTPLNHREVNPERRPAHRRIPQRQLGAVAFDDVLDHRQADALPRVLTVQTLAAFENPCALILWHAGAVVLDTQLGAAEGFAHTDAYFPKAQAIGVFQQVAQHLQ